ncbi:fused MFS/spermidine synthase [Streptomyces sp. HNM0574]|uniref:spermidine synthase n=1 Tax=Streptomyces sp. HNM0574 TaxID=2714954 RepID=UPI00146E458E|nr:fused MFS/spermidine synthase [Streptomyces sp. HNM0574]NLU69897.1 fused MFS/spermidine synthase [Streptomyces sp. HNM0574]
MDDPIPVSRAVDHGTAKLMPDVDRDHAWLLTLDGSPQSYVDLDDPTHLEFEYARRVAHFLDTTAPAGTPLSVLHLGGGALTLPRYLAATRPGSAQHVVDADAALLDLVTEVLPLPSGSGIDVRAADARAALESAEPGSRDVVIGDVYGGTRVPAHLTTLPYAHAAARALREDGLYLLNIADAAPFGFLGSQLATLAAVFPELCLVAEPSVLRGRRYGNIVVAGSRRPLPCDEVARRSASDVFPARVVRGAGLDRFVQGRSPVADGDAVPSPEPPEGAFTIG